MDLYKQEMIKRVGISGFKCNCCNTSRGKLKNSHVGKDNSLNKFQTVFVKTNTYSRAMLTN